MADWILPDLRDILGPTLGLTVELPQPGAGGLPLGSRVAPTSDGFLIWMNPCNPHSCHSCIYIFLHLMHVMCLSLGTNVGIELELCKQVCSSVIMFLC